MNKHSYFVRKPNTVMSSKRSRKQLGNMEKVDEKSIYSIFFCPLLGILKGLKLENHPK